ncbi:MAG: carbohydrate ABC transporter substrate-binding protein [Clostridia bacterium]|nr:carbohydrate ABC transporter substrate-binding protein [Clostridia bacterium]MBQ8973895.1 carbohydrate ABC transporter substrate-binding protein [Clostridia bacterium]
MKKFLSMLLILALAISMSSMAFAAEDGKLTIWCWDVNFNVAAMEVAKKMYQEEHPDVEIEVVNSTGSGDIETSVVQAATAGDLSTLADIILYQDNSYQKLVANYPEVFTDLTDLYDFTDFAEGKSSFSIVDGHHYGIPFDAGTAVAAYRTDVLEQAGYTIDDMNDITWDRAIEIGKDVKEKTGLPLFSAQAGSSDWTVIILKSCGASMFNEDGSVNLKDNDQLKAALDVYLTLVREGVLVEVNSWDEYIGTMSNESVVGTFNGCWILASVMSLTDQAGKWGMANIPSLVGVDGATNYSSNGGSSWAITQGTDIDLAVDFMQAYRNVDFYNEILPTTSAIASYNPAKEGSNYTDVNEFMGTPVFADIIEYGEHVPPVVSSPYYYDARDALATAQTNILNGADIQAELENAQNTVEFAMDF